MNIDFVSLAQQAHAEHRRRIVLPESNDSRILEAAVDANRKGVCEVTLLGRHEVVKARLEGMGYTAVDYEGIEITNPSHSPNLAGYADALFARRAKKGLTQSQAKTLVETPLCYANMMVGEGDVDACIAGAELTSADVVRTALQVIGTQSPTTRLSSFLIMQGAQFPTPVLFADCAINIDPDASQLADIALQSAVSARAMLGVKPNVAMLSFSSNGSTPHPNAEKVALATQLLRERAPELDVLGEIQFDAAFDLAIRAKKWPDAPNLMPVNVFVFPSLEASNIGYKIAERIGGATAIGPILQGLRKPVNDLSRGADVEAIINTIAVTALQA